MIKTQYSNRIAALRGEIVRRGLSGVVIPRADAHQGEYVAPCDERLAWVSGFTGSAGSLVVLENKAALFVDGRYTLQAARETDPELVEIHPVGEERWPMERWIEGALTTGDRLGFDPRLHTQAQVKRLTAACAKAGAVVAALPDNPVDAVWSDRPEPPSGPVGIHPAVYSGHAPGGKRALAADSLADEHLDAAVLSDPSSVAWLLDIRGTDIPHLPVVLAFAVIHADASVDLFLDPARLNADLLAHLGPDVRLHGPDRFWPFLETLKDKKVRADQSTTSAAIVERLGDAADLGRDPCLLPRARKNAVELDGARAAHRRDGVALCRFLAWASQNPETDELAAAAVLEGFRAGNALYRGPSFPAIAALGPNGAVVHYRSTPQTNRRFEPGTLFLIDSGGQYLDGTTDVTRTLAIGPAGDEERRRFTLVLKGHIALARAVFPAGTTGPQIDCLARQFLWEAGLDYDHGTGHGVGSFLSVHEGPQRIGKTSAESPPLEAGMILSIEPGYYKAGAYGIRLENLAAVRAVPAPMGAERPLLGFEPLTLAPFDRALIDAALLTEAEIAWLDAYHQAVADQIGPLLPPADRAWLENATRPIRATG